MRIFIAVNLPDSVKKALERVILVLKHENQAQPIKWVEPQLLHITLHFLGGLELNDADKVSEVLEKTVSRFSKMRFRLGELGAFPDLKNPRIIFAQATEIGDGSIAKLRHELFSRLKDLGFEVDDRKWIPHITIGRVKERTSSLQGTEKINIEPIEWVASSVDLMESVLKPEGPEYKVAREIELK